MARGHAVASVLAGSWRRVPRRLEVELGTLADVAPLADLGRRRRPGLAEEATALGSAVLVRPTGVGL
jgi:hypothetical protein